ncbi:MAG: hypothetical protein ACLT98_17665 [Eggerthellaceae bacterium]
MLGLTGCGASFEGRLQDAASAEQLAMRIDDRGPFSRGAGSRSPMARGADGVYTGKGRPLRALSP